MGDLFGGRWEDYYKERRGVICPGCRHEALSHVNQGSAVFPNYYCEHTVYYDDQDGWHRCRPCGCMWSFTDMMANQGGLKDGPDSI